MSDVNPPAKEPSAKPVVTVVIVSDYAGGQSKTWDDLRATLSALARQDFGGATEFLLVECAAFEHQIPSDLATMAPNLRVALSSGRGSYALKNAGVRAAAAELVALLDADCVPGCEWLRHLVDALQGDASAAAVSGRTVYAGRTLTERALALVARAYVDRGAPGNTRYISNNNAAFRRAAFLAHPLPTDAGPFATRMQSEAIRRSGARLLFEPGMRVIHDFHGWAMEVDMRRNAGYGTIITRLRDPGMPYAWLLRLGYASIPVFAMAKTLESCWDCLRCAPHFGIRWYELPVALFFAAVTHAMEVPGLVRAFRGQAITRTAYR